MSPTNWTQKNPALADAAKHYPKRVFQEWLKLRRQGADTFCEGWRKVEDRQRRVELLNLGAALKAAFN